MTYRIFAGYVKNGDVAIIFIPTGNEPYDKLPASYDDCLGGEIPRLSGHRKNFDIPLPAAGHFIEGAYMKKALAIDMGATSIRGIIGYIEDGEVKLEEVMRFPHEIKKSNGRFRWDFDGLLNKIAQTVKNNADSISSVGIDTWGVDFGLIDKAGNLVEPPVCYRDPKHREGFDEAVKILGCREIFAETGTQIMSINTLFQLLTLRKLNPEVYNKAWKLLMMPDLIGYLLTGNAVGEETILSTAQMLNLKTEDYSERLIKELGLDRNKLPEITKAGSIIGNVKNGLIAELKGLDIEVVSVCGHDTASAVLLTKVMTDEDTMFLSCGTWSLFGIRAAGPDLSEQAYEKGLTNELGYNSTPLLFKNLTGLYLFEKYKSGYEKKLGRKLGFDEITAYVEESLKKEETISNLIDMENPRFASGETDAKEAIDAFLKERGRNLPENDMDYFRIIYESMVYKYAEVKEALEEISGKKYKKIHMIGGGAKSSLLCRLIAKRLGVEITAGPYEASALGNILVQLKAIGEIRNIEEGLEAAYKSLEIKQY